MTTKFKNITVFGLGYVGLSMMLLISKKYKVKGIDIDKNKIDKLKKGIPTINEPEVSYYLSKYSSNLSFFNTITKDIHNSDIFILCTPTNYDEKKFTFDTSSLDKTIRKINRINNDARIVIKSTVPIGYTAQLEKKYKSNEIIFSPEFLTEGKSLYDNLYPSRIIVGGQTEFAKSFSRLLCDLAKKKSVSTMLTSSTEAESIKLFSNAFLALRVAYFNELDSFTIENNLNTKNIIKGIGLDPRIGNYYNNPSFGYGGYCLPKDTKQLLSDYKRVPNEIIKSIIKSNETRKAYVAQQISKFNKIGIYRLIMKSKSENFRDSSVVDVIKILNRENKKVIIYEPLYTGKTFMGNKVINNLKQFKKNCEIVLANRKDKSINDVNSKVFTRDIFEAN